MKIKEGCALAQKNAVIIGVDIGYNNIKYSYGIADVVKGSKILGASVIDAKAIRASGSYDLPCLTSCLETCFSDIEKNIPVLGGYLYVTLGGEDVGKHTRVSYVDIKNRESQVLKNDIIAIKNLVKDVILEDTKQIVHVLPIGYELDGVRNIKNPLGMYGTRLGMHANIISANTSHIQNIVQAIKGCGLEVEEFRLGLLSSADVILSQEQKQKGMILINVGAEFTEISLFHNGCLSDFSIIRTGGNNITAAISDGFSVPFDFAEKLKIRYGGCISKTNTCDENLIIKTETSQKYFSRAKLCQIVDDSSRDVILKIKEQISQKYYYKDASCGAVITGGGACLEGFIELAEDLLGVECRMGALDQTVKSELSLNITDVNFAPVVGLVKYGFDRFLLRKHFSNTFFSKAIRTVKDFYMEYF